MKNCFYRDLLVSKEEAKVMITGIVYDKAASVGKGARFAPSKLSELSKALPAFNMDGKDLRSLGLFLNESIKPKDINDLIIKTKNFFDNDKFNIFIGGDHSCSIATERAFFDFAKKINKEPVIIHIDAHPDFCYEYEGTKFSHACPNMRSYEYGYKLENITLVGIRGYEAQEVEFFNKHPELDIFNASFILNNGIDEVINKIINKYHDDKYLIYISYDIDANDPSFAPGTGTPEAFGLKPFDILKLIKALFENCHVGCFDLMEVSPPLDNNNDITSWLALKTLYEIFGYIIGE